MTATKARQPVGPDTIHPPVDWRRVSIGAGAAMFVCMGLGRFSYSAMVPALVEAGRLDAVAAGYVGGANMIGFLIGAAVSTLAPRALRLDRLLWSSLVLAVLGLLASSLPWGPTWLGAWRGAIGVSTGLVMVLGLAVTAQTAPANMRTVAMSYIFVGVGCGILFGATVVPASLSYSLEAAWLSVAVAGAVAAAFAAYMWHGIHRAAAPAEATLSRPPVSRATWVAVVIASTLFSFGIVAHTLYWFDFIARDLGLGYTLASLHWAGVGVFAILGPILAARLAASIGNASATACVYALMAIGIALPWFSHASPALIASTMIFGAQPAVSTLLGARARDLGEPSEMAAMMRAIIFANAVGSGLAGVGIPKLLDVTGSYDTLFLVGGIAFLIGFVLCLPPALRR